MYWNTLQTIAQSLRWVQGVQACEQPIYMDRSLSGSLFLHLSLHLFPSPNLYAFAWAISISTRIKQIEHNMRVFSTKRMIEMWMPLMRARRSALKDDLRTLKESQPKAFYTYIFCLSVCVTWCASDLNAIFSPNFDVYVCFCLCWRWMRVCMPRICLCIFDLRRI